MLIPSSTPSGRPIPRSVPFRSLHEIASLVARGRIVHPTGDGVVPYRLMWARSSFTSSGGLGMVRVSWTARCFRPRSCRAATRPAVYRGQPNRIQTSGSGRCEFRACRISFSCGNLTAILRICRAGVRRQAANSHR
jgi:hypothetical protein